MAFTKNSIAKELFPSRIRKGGLKIKEARNGKSLGSYEPTKAEVAIPLSEDAKGRTVRLHEALHITHSPANLHNSMVEQTVEDARLHLNEAHTTGSVRRDEVATAMREVRDINEMGKYLKKTGRTKMSAEQRNEALASLVRGAAILSANHEGNLSELPPSYMRQLLKAETAIGSPVLEKTGQALQNLSKGYTREALDILKNLFTGKAGETKADPDDEPCDLDNDTAAKMEALGCPLKDLENMDDLKELFESKEIGRQIGQAIKSPNPPEMRIRPLALSQPKRSAAPTERMSMAGMKIRAKKLASAAISPCPGRVFERRIRQKGGTAVIDASGSMNLSDAQLIKISDMIPAGTVAYYSGDEHNSGDLVIYAERGKQYNNTNKTGKLPYRDGGNSVDFPALMWLLQQPAPRYFVTDGGFCGADPMYCQLATKMLHEATVRGLVTWVRNLDELEKDMRKATTQKKVFKGEVDC